MGSTPFFKIFMPGVKPKEQRALIEYLLLVVRHGLI